MAQRREFSVHALSGPSHDSVIALTGTWYAPGIREGNGAGPVAWRKRGHCHPRPGAVPWLPRTGKGHRRGPDDRARIPAGTKSGRPRVGEKSTIWLSERGTPGAIAEGWEGAILLLNRAPTQRPVSRLPQQPDANAGVARGEASVHDPRRSSLHGIAGECRAQRGGERRLRAPKAAAHR